VWLGLGGWAAAAELPPLLTGANHPQAVAVGPDGHVYVTVAGEVGKDGTGAVLVVADGKAVPFATGLDDPRGLVAWSEWLFVADRQRVWRIDRKGKANVFVAAAAFPTPPHALHAIDVDEEGKFYVSDPGSPNGSGGAVYRIGPKGKVELVTDARRSPALRSPRGLTMDGLSHLLVTDGASRTLLRLRLSDGATTPVAPDCGGEVAWDRFGRLYFTDGHGTVLGIPRPGERPVQLAPGYRSEGGLCVAPDGHTVLVADPYAREVRVVRATIPGWEVDDTPMPVEAAVAFPDLRWTGWSPENERGQSTPLRPVVLTHAGDGSNRVFVATEHGVIHVFPNDQHAERTRVFLDLRDRVVYDDNQNEEGFLGLAFHPNYKKNGEFFVFYTTRKAKLTNILAGFRVRPDDPNRADPASEEELLRIEKPYWNHNGGTITFGPDGYLYVAVGDGGLANDPHQHGQDLGKVFGKVLRLDVDHKEPGKNYAVPKDNPFMGRAGARPEVWAYGLRNVWRMAFDRKTGALWASDVGQNLYEEIDLLTAGGNYGWSVREGLHPFGARGSGLRPDLIEPIWEYRHYIGKSLTGGAVYRGRRLPELDGLYLYGDYVSGKFWALRYAPAKRRVVANRPIAAPSVPVLSFGEDEQGEVYFLTYTPTGRGIYRFVRPNNGKRTD
jgi:glucose/arabinose dehydrogenase